MPSYLTIGVLNADEIIKDMQQSFDVLPSVIKKASATAMNKTLRQVKKEAVKIPRKIYTARSYSLTKRATITKARTGNLRAKLELKDRNGIGLINFAPRPADVLSWKGIAPKNRKKIVTNKIRRDGKRRVYNDHGSPFVANVKNGKHIFYRDSQDKLKRLYGPSLIYALFGADKELQNHAEAVFPKVLQEELEKVLYAK